jgi:hypothetical protein
MAKRDADTSTTVALLGGGALVAWLLLRGGGGGGGGAAVAGVAPAVSPAAPPPCRVRVRERSIELNGAPSSLPVMVNACRAAGSADLAAAGDAVVGVVADVVQALDAAGVRVAMSTSLRDLIDSYPRKAG